MERGRYGVELFSILTVVETGMNRGEETVKNFKWAWACPHTYK